VYLDLSFFDELDRRFGAPGDFAQGYVVAHEVGHHVQNLIGIAEKVEERRRSSSEVEANRMSVRMELQADCYAGIWAREGLAQEEPARRGRHRGGPAGGGGDRRRHPPAQGPRARWRPRASPTVSSAQRVEWFRKGYESGQVPACDTFRRS
jgi:predicted metalloprotease